MFFIYVVLMKIVKHVYIIQTFKKRPRSYETLQIKNASPLLRSHLYYIEFTEATSIILKTKYDMLDVHWGLNTNTRKTRMKLKLLKIKERQALRAVKAKYSGRPTRLQQKAISNPNRHVLVVLSSRKAYWNTTHNKIIAEY